jgi:2'-5' RNA ligase
VRAFIAICLPEEARETLAASVIGLRQRWPGLAWTSPAGYHLTVAFLGDVESEALACARRALAFATAEKAFGFRFSGLGSFPARGAARILFARIEPEEPCARLYRLVNEALEAETRRSGIANPNRDWVEGAAASAPGGLDSRARPFSAHVTLARSRFRGGHGAQAGASEIMMTRLEIPARAAWTIERCALYKSDLRPGGAVYTELDSAALRR